MTPSEKEEFVQRLVAGEATDEMYQEIQEKEIARVRAKVQAKAERMVKGAIGKFWRIRTRKASRTQSGVLVSGEITRCEIREIRVTGNRVQAFFNVWINGRGPFGPMRRLP